MFKVLAVAGFVLIGASAEDGCMDFSTCLDCKADGCGWFKDKAVGIVMQCRNSTAVTESTVLSETLESMGECPKCQAGTCAKCQDQEECSWFTNLFDAKCAETNDPPQAYAAATECPKCDSDTYTDCKSCSDVEGCNWYEVFGAQGECAEEQPTGKTLKPAAACSNGAICEGYANCGSCTTNTSDACSWYKVKSGLAALASAKCDFAGMTGVQAPFYDEVEGKEGNCPACTADNCLDCQKDEACAWYDYKGIGGTCQLAAEDKPLAADLVANGRCWGECELFSCETCNENDLCAWYVPKGAVLDVRDSVCSFKENSPLIGVDTIYDKPETCPKCAAERCFECSELEECQWEQQKFTGLLGKCDTAGEDPAFGSEVIDADSDKCEGPEIGSAGRAGVSGAMIFAIVALMI